MRRNSSTIVVLTGPVPGEVRAAVDRSMNVALIHPEDRDGNSDGGAGIEQAAAALRRAGRATSPYAMVTADPLAAVAGAWRAMWDVSRQSGPDEFEQEAVKVLAAWRANQFELPDYYLVLAPEEAALDFHLGALRAARPHRVALVAATEPAHQAVAVLHTLGSLRHGPWWPPLDQLIDTARAFYPNTLTEADA
jgi:hypothetical protein